MKLNSSQQEIIELLKNKGRLSVLDISKELEVAKSDLSSDLALLTNLGIIGSSQKSSYYYMGNKNYIVFAELLKYYSVENIMSMPVIIEETESVYDAIVCLFLENVSSIYITKNKNLVGVVSRKDLLRAAIGKLDLRETPVNIIMTRMPNIKRVNIDTSVFECAKIIVDSQIDGVPVVEEKDGSVNVIGRVTKTNLTNLFVRLGYNYSVEEIL